MRQRHRFSLVLHTAALAIFALARSSLAVDFNQSTGDLLYDDGAGNTLPYRLFLPEGYDPNVNYPLLLFFHGAGERGTDNRAQASGGGHMENLYRATQGRTFEGRYKALLLTPQCPTSDQWVNWPWARGSYTQAEEPPESQSMHSALAILDQVLAEYPIDANQVYVTGLSMGGFGTWDALRRRPGLFAAAMPLSGGGNKDRGAAFSRIPVWAYHGSSDGVVPVRGADELRDSIAAAGGSIEYTRVRAGHSGWSTFYNNRTYTNSADQTVYEWLFTQTLQGPLKPFEITSLELASDGEDRQANLTWNSRGRRTYVIQVAAESTEWSNLPFSVASAGKTTSAIIPIPSDSRQSLYRVREGLPSENLISDSTVHWLVPSDDSLQATWNSIELPASAGFVVGEGIGVGFETRPETFDPFIDSHVLEPMLRVNASIYLRYAFAPGTDRQYRSLTLSMRYDDGFVAYLNGTQIAARNAPAEVGWDSTATSGNSDSDAVEFEDIDVSGFINLLLPGQENVLAIQGLNKTMGGSDFLIMPQLSGEFEGGP